MPEPSSRSKTAGDAGSKGQGRIPSNLDVQSIAKTASRRENAEPEPSSRSKIAGDAGSKGHGKAQTSLGMSTRSRAASNSVAPSEEHVSGASQPTRKPRQPRPEVDILPAQMVQRATLPSDADVKICGDEEGIADGSSIHDGSPSQEDSDHWMEGVDPQLSDHDASSLGEDHMCVDEAEDQSNADRVLAQVSPTTPRTTTTSHLIDPLSFLHKRTSSGRQPIPTHIFEAPALRGTGASGQKAGASTHRMQAPSATRPPLATQTQDRTTASGSGPSKRAFSPEANFDSSSSPAAREPAAKRRVHVELDVDPAMLGTQAVPNSKQAKPKAPQSIGPGPAVPATTQQDEQKQGAANSAAASKPSRQPLLEALLKSPYAIKAPSQPTPSPSTQSKPSGQPKRGASLSPTRIGPSSSSRGSQPVESCVPPPRVGAQRLLERSGVIGDPPFTYQNLPREPWFVGEAQQEQRQRSQQNAEWQDLHNAPGNKAITLLGSCVSSPDRVEDCNRIALQKMGFRIPSELQLGVKFPAAVAYAFCNYRSEPAIVAITQRMIDYVRKHDYLTEAALLLDECTSIEEWIQRTLAGEGSPFRIGVLEEIFEVSFRWVDSFRIPAGPDDLRFELSTVAKRGDLSGRSYTLVRTARNLWFTATAEQFVELPPPPAYTLTGKRRFRWFEELGRHLMEAPSQEILHNTQPSLPVSGQKAEAAPRPRTGSAAPQASGSTAERGRPVTAGSLKAPDGTAASPRARSRSPIHLPCGRSTVLHVRGL